MPMMILSDNGFQMGVKQTKISNQLL